MPTVATLKTAYQDLVAPNDDALFLRLLQEADNRLLDAGKWNWTRAKITLTPVDGFVTLPVAYTAILGARVGTYAKPIHTEEFEFVAGGVGEVPIEGCGDYRLVDQGKVEQESGPPLRTYKVAGGEELTDDVVALVRLAYSDLILPDDSGDGDDETRCPDQAALKLALYGVVYELNNDLERAGNYWTSALNSLDRVERSYRAGAQHVQVVQPWGRGVSGIRNMF